MFVAASTRCFADKGFAEACHLLTDLEFDKVELWFDDHSQHLRRTEVASNIEGFFSQFREVTRHARRLLSRTRRARRDPARLVQTGKADASRSNHGPRFTAGDAI